MGRYLGSLSSDAYDAVVNEMRIGHYNIPAASVVAPDADGILDGTAFPDAAGTVTTFLAQPPCAMTLTAVASGTQTGKVTIHGFDIGGNKISEELTMVSTTPVAGVKAFAEVTAIDLPIKVSTETIDVGWGAKFGIPYKLAADELCIVKLFDAAADAGTLTVDADDLSKNVYDPNGTPDGEKALDLYFIL